MRGKVSKRLHALCRLTSGPTRRTVIRRQLITSGLKKVVKEAKKTYYENRSKPLEKIDKNKEK